MKPYYANELTTIFNNNCFDIFPEIPDESIDLVLSDIPYKLDVTKKEGFLRDKRPNAPLSASVGTWDEFPTQKSFEEFIDKLVDESYRVLKPSGTIIFFGCRKQERLVEDCLEKKFQFLNKIIWEKTNPSPLIMKMRLIFSYELIFAFRKGKGNTVNWQHYPYSEMHDVFRGSLCCGTSKERVKDPETGKSLHSTQKPLWLMEKLVKIFSNEGDLILDPCAGVLTTCEAAQKNNRHSIGIDMIEKYLVGGIERLK